MLQSWPEYSKQFNFAAEENAMELVMDAIKAIRARRSDMNVPPSKKAELLVVTEEQAVFTAGIPFLKRLANASDVTVAAEAPADVNGLVSVVTAVAKLYIPLAELVDLDAERARLAKEIEKAEKYLAGIEKKLSNEKFVAKAPEAVVQRERDNMEKTRALIGQLKESAAALG